MNGERLLQLADHLETGNLGHELFAFDVFNSTDSADPIEPYTCGTKGCAVGECPVIWPENWCFNKNAMPTVKDWGSEPGSPQADELPKHLRDHERLISASSILMYAAHWFGISPGDADLLFVPDISSAWSYQGSDHLPGDVTKEAVAVNIREFVKKRSES
jgi:hypothetical protein